MRLILLGFVFVCSVSAESIQLAKEIPGFDPKAPARQIVVFQANCNLEVEFDDSLQMYRVKCRNPDGQEINALCYPQDIKSSQIDSQSLEPRKTETSPSPLTPDQLVPEPKGSSEVPPLDSAMSFENSIWTMQPKDFSKKMEPYYFKSVSSIDQNTWRSSRSLQFLNQKVYESIARFKTNQLAEVQLLIYGRGDAEKELSESDFSSMIKTTESSLDVWMNSKGIDAPIQNNAMDVKRRSWFRVPYRVDLESSFTRSATVPFDSKKKFRAEFLRLTLSPYDGKRTGADLVKPNYREAPKSTTVRRIDLKDRIKREQNGDVYMDGVPMVDQGAKGYCVVASTERVMRYYGIQVDQNDLAKVANSSAGDGTSVDAMKKALDKIKNRYSLNIKEYMKTDLRGFLSEMNEYNRVAKKEKKNPIIVPQSGMIDMESINSQIETDILRQVRLKTPVERNRFVDRVSDVISNGGLVLWGVTLGWVQEGTELPQSVGGHMRLIIGYNKTTSEIIYTDSWGAGHEFKRMPMDDAFLITSGIYSVIPSM
jgi:hypothetical protein